MFKTHNFAKPVALALALASVSALPAAASGYGTMYGGASAEAGAAGGSDGLVTNGRTSGVVTEGASSASTYANGDPKRARGRADDARIVVLGSQGRNGAAGDFYQDSNAYVTVKGDSRRGRSATGTTSGYGEYDAGAVGSSRFSEGMTAGVTRTRARAADNPGRRNDRSTADAQQSTMAAAESRASDRNHASARSEAQSESRARVTD